MKMKRAPGEGAPFGVLQILRLETWQSKSRPTTKDEGMYTTFGKIVNNSPLDGVWNFLRTTTKRAVLRCYIARVFTLPATQRVIDALRLWGA